jgi:hypothetical protein
MLGVLIEMLRGSEYLFGGGGTYQRSDDILAAVDAKRFGRKDLRVEERADELGRSTDGLHEMRCATLKLLKVL